MQLVQLTQQADIQVQRDGHIRCRDAGAGDACQCRRIACHQNEVAGVVALGSLINVDFFAALQHQAQQWLDDCVIDCCRRGSAQQNQPRHRRADQRAAVGVPLTVVAGGVDEGFVHALNLRWR